MFQEFPFIIYKNSDTTLLHQAESYLQSIGFKQGRNFQFESLFDLLYPFKSQNNTIDKYGLVIDINNKIYNVIDASSVVFCNNFLKIPVISDMDELFKKVTCKKEKQEGSPNNTFESALKPGRIIVFEDGDKTRYGFIIKPNIIVYVNSKGEIQGYLKNFTEDNPYKVTQILIPTDEKFKLTECSEMLVAWKRKDPIIVKKTKEEIEKALGLEPGTLEIS